MAPARTDPRSSRPSRTGMSGIVAAGYRPAARLPGPAHRIVPSEGNVPWR